MKILILAGGFATRLWPLSEKHAKPLLLLAGKTIIAHLLDRVPKDADIALLTNKKFEEDFKSELQKIGRQSIQIFCEDAYSDGEKLGALGAISVACRELNIDDNLLVLAGDNLLPELQISDLLCSSNSARIAVREVGNKEEARKFGVVEIDDGKVIGFEEKPENPKSTLVSTGFLALGKGTLPILHEYAKKAPDALGGIFPELLRKGIFVSAVKVDGEWFDIGSFETYLSAHKVLQTEAIVRGKKVREKNCRFSGKVFLGDNVILENCTLHDVIVYPGTVLQDCHITTSVIDEGCTLCGLDLSQKLVRSGVRFGEVV
jgi:glucose-1-phosphate thymidylyltransferase